MAIQELIKGVQELRADEIRQCLSHRAIEEKAIRALLRAAAAREREERRQAKIHSAEIAQPRRK